MDYSTMTAKEINDFVEIFQRLLENKKGNLTEETINGLKQELRDAKLEIVLNKTSP